MFSKNTPCTCKVLHVKRGHALSLQRHKNRRQVYFIIDPLRIWDGEAKIDAKPGTWFDFPAGHLHRAENLGPEDTARYLEVSFGDYDETDIERVKDRYGRGAEHG